MEVNADMKLLVMSDSHRRKNALSEIIEINRDADAFIFLGDGLNDFDDALAENALDPTDYSKEIIAVPGNCDFFGRPAGHVIRQLGGISFYITHGADENVKIGFWSLLEAAKRNGCKVALYGHTHLQKAIETDGIYLFNPGAVERGQYGIIEIKDGQPVFRKKTL